ncbi:hypothetical protein VNO77_03974 [Canavalia gladiata]|uniref:Uncharacterized protein n=1 Tax=Canavalia gladiata TaxID=3824 RepID=A0AAN9N1D2_CANGL
MTLGSLKDLAPAKKKGWPLGLREGSNSFQTEPGEAFERESLIVSRVSPSLDRFNQEDTKIEYPVIAAHEIDRDFEFAKLRRIRGSAYIREYHSSGFEETTLNPGDDHAGIGGRRHRNLMHSILNDISLFSTEYPITPPQTSYSEGWSRLIKQNGTGLAILTMSQDPASFRVYEQRIITSNGLVPVAHGLLLGSLRYNSNSHENSLPVPQIAHWSQESI